MARSTIPGRHIEIQFAEADRIVEFDLEDEDDGDDPAIASVVIAAIGRDDPNDAERVLRDGVVGTVRRRP